jgi:hypothetical protein
VLLKILEAGGHLKSYALAARMLRQLAEVSISDRHVACLVTAVGRELQADRDRRTEDYLHHRRPPPGEPVPAAVSVAVDGGRVQTRATVAGQGPGVHGHGWKEDKVACLHVLDGPTFDGDPHPQPPRCFVDAAGVAALVRDFQKQRGLAPLAEGVGAAAGATVPAADDDVPSDNELSLAEAPPDNGPAPAAAAPAARADPGAPPAAAAAAPAGDDRPAWPPRRQARTCVATMSPSAAFGKMLAQEAYARHFFAAPRAAFLGDGQQYNWTIQRKWFKDFVAITDFIHPLAYLYLTATAVATTVAERWSLYVAWLTACWQGRVAEVVAALRDRQQQLGPAGADAAAASDPRVVLARTLTYLTHNAPRMDYPRYRQQGLPVTSAVVESLIKEINYRVKGTEKFWNQPSGAEAILQVRAALLSSDERLARHVAGRPGSPYRYHRHRPATGPTGEAA